ncbi:SSI family serine proteinase inhibitor [Streptomyces boncukensis]|uniref:Protease inhibitor protein n=1 Tax=Streptomyces boncukensis TaxID=2711219 RepID=A0A6G4X947_9ACTN|nr:SSI family serine proteinase inhibitor [Streptomyces boncukensis]NGO73380.1 protease inhibitor protein [Streptomyces boncukensis]
MRKTAQRTAAATTVAVCCLALTAATAATAGAAPHAPAQDQERSTASASRMVLGVGHHDGTDRMVPERVVYLDCLPTTSASDHPRALRACDDLVRVDGSFRSLVGLNQSKHCTMEYNPVTVTVDGYWKGNRVEFAHTFANPCIKRLNASYLFQF